MNKMLVTNDIVKEKSHHIFQGQQGGLVGKGACCQASWPEFNPQDPHGKRGTDSHKLSPDFHKCHVHACMHTSIVHTYIYTYIQSLRENQLYKITLVRQDLDQPLFSEVVHLCGCLLHCFSLSQIEKFCFPNKLLKEQCAKGKCQKIAAL